MREVARKVRDRSRKMLREMRLQGALARLERRLRDGGQPDDRLMAQLVHGWDNEAWSADTAFLKAMMDWLPRTSGAIVECGSGLSTVVLATAAALYGRRLYSFEHNPDWAQRVLSELPPSARDSLQLNITPLRDYGGFDWYSLGSAQLPSSVGFVVCDGPPGTTRGGRYGLGPVLRSYLAPGCVILLDDVQRDSEQAVLGRWCTELNAERVAGAHSYGVLRVEPRAGNGLNA